MTALNRALSIPLRRPIVVVGRAKIDTPPVQADQQLSSPPPSTSRAAFQLTPRITGHDQRLIAERLSASQAVSRRKALERLAAEFVRRGTSEGRAAQVVALLLADLDRQGWIIEGRGSELWATPPRATGEEGEPAAQVKQRLREALLAFRAEQLGDPAVRAFLRRMETPRHHRGRRVSVLDLVDDGRDLAVALTEAARLPPSERAAALDRVIRPVIEPATGDAKCDETGLPLVDVWRYFRHTWSLEYRPTPGRTLFLLIRNAARPGRPVMGIASLTNAQLQIRVRDRWIGWNAQGLLDRLAHSATSWPKEREGLLRTLHHARAHIRMDDLLQRAGGADAEEFEARLLAIAGAAARERACALQERARQQRDGEELAPIKRLPLDENGRVDWRKASETPLFVYKRAQTLARLLFAERILGTIPEDAPDIVERLRSSSDAMRALAIATQEIRKVGLASRLLELNVCGAAPPYRELLGGKLAALAVASAEVCEAYTSRYKEQASEIASQMAGREVVRDASAYVITTTSLYAVASSQYNRLKVTTATPRGPVEIRWKDFGLTEGFGTTHLGDELFRAMREYSVLHRGGRNVNNVFGEGQSPRLRQAREALADLRLEPNAILQHSAPRRVYGLELFPGACEALRTNRQTSVERPPFAVIAAAWRDRWLARRITSREVLERVAAQGPLSLRAELTPPTPQLDLFFAPPTSRRTPPPPAPARTVPMSRESDIPLIRGLYRATNACSEHLDERDVRRLHIHTPVEGFIAERAKAGGVVFVTGNPGDGKTFLLRHLEPKLREHKVEVRFDANELTENELIDRVDYTLARRGRRLAVAINEGILVHLLRTAQGKPWAKAAQHQLLNPFVYRPGEAAPPDHGVTVVDLNLRNNLSRKVVGDALRKMRDLAGPCAGCPGARCDLQRAVGRLEGVPAERVEALLEAVSKTGFHATMRDLQGFLSYLLFGDRGCEEFKDDASRQQDYWTSAFDGGKGALFDAVRTFDPRTRSLPLLDDELWRYADQPEHWKIQHPEVRSPSGTLAELQERFVARKRRALFEHAKGEAILELGGSGMDTLMRTILGGGKTAVTTTVRALNTFFDRDERGSDVLYLWVTHRYDAQPCRYAAASRSIAASELEILVPQLRPDLRDAFEGYQADHAILCKKGAPAATGLRLDRPLVAALYAAGQGLPSAFRRGEPEARVAAFFDKLVKQVPADQDDRVEVRLVDRDTGKNLRVTVDVTGGRYVSCIES